MKCRPDQLSKNGTTSLNKDFANKRGKENHDKISKTHTDRKVLLNNDGYSMKNIPKLQLLILFPKFQDQKKTKESKNMQCLK